MCRSNAAASSDADAGERAAGTPAPSTHPQPDCRDVLTQIGDGCFCLDAAGVHVDVNPALCSMTGFSRDELVGAGPPHPYWPPEEIAVIEAAYAQTPAADARGLSLTFMRKDGTRIPVRVTPAVTRSSDGEIAGTFAIVKSRTGGQPAGTEADAAQTAERYRLLLQNLNEAVYVHQMTRETPGRFLDVNDRACEMLGYTRDELLALDVPAIDVPEQAERLPDILRRLHETGSSVFTTEHVTKDGRRIPVEVSTRLFEMHGEPTVLSVVRDISKQMAAERAVQETQRLLDETQELSRLGGWEYDVATSHLTWTREVYRIYGVDPEYDTNDLERALSFYPPEGQQAVADAFRSAVESGTPYDLEVPFIRADGRRIWVRTLARADVEDGHVVRVLGNIVDITERKQAEEALAAARERARTYLDIAGVMIVAVGADEVVTLANRKTCEILGRPESEIVGRDWFDLAIPDEARTQVKEVFGKLMDGTAKPWSTFENEVLTAGGERRLIAWYNVLLYEADGSVTGTLSSGADVTERRAAEAEIRRLNEELRRRVTSQGEQLDAATRELEALAYSVAHDVRAPLRAIDGFSAAVMEDEAGRLSEEGVAALRRVRNGAQTLARLLDELTGLSQVSRRKLARSDVDLTALALEVGEETADAHPSRSMELTVAPGLVAHADEALLRLILRELLGNAWKFTAPHPSAHVEVGAREREGEHLFFVRDDGVGFDMRQAGHLFGVFQRMHPSEQFEGDGVGLATVQRLVRRHGGRCWAESEPEEGTTVFFTLPRPDDDR